MPNQTIVRDPKLRRLVSDFDALTDVPYTLIDRDHRLDRPAGVASPHEMEFTTEWQMVSTAEEVHAS